MKKIIFVILALLLMLSGLKTAAALTAVIPGAATATQDSNPAALSFVDQVWLSAESVAISSGTKNITTVNVLVNRITRQVEYVWSYIYNCYVRPKYSIPNIQSLYDAMHPK